MKWQHIEAAPKDGTEIQLLDPKPDQAYGPDVHAGFWDTSRNMGRGDWVALSRQTDPFDIDPIAWAPFLPPPSENAEKMPEIQKEPYRAIADALAEMLLERPEFTPDSGTFTRDELDLLRQWYNSMEDTNPAAIDADGFDDTKLYIKIMGLLGLPVRHKP